ncbi:hypothetical protein FPV67DRAFT_1756719 [Lyophyllum atratum]|nr:hypothetical protein FPV67DRAFT_1756719 [Lyophyllum atratum]
MIRRTPTLIPMGDFDVQDVRDMLAKQKADQAQHLQLIAKMKRIAQNPNMEKEDYEVMEQLKAAAARQDRARRLGLQPGMVLSLSSLDLLLNRMHRTFEIFLDDKTPLEPYQLHALIYHILPLNKLPLEINPETREGIAFRIAKLHVQEVFLSNPVRPPKPFTACSLQIVLRAILQCYGRRGDLHSGLLRGEFYVVLKHKEILHRRFMIVITRYWGNVVLSTLLNLPSVSQISWCH